MFIRLLLCAVLFSAVTATATETVSEKYGVSLTLPDRWTHRETVGKSYFRVHADDSRDQANVMLTALRARKDTSIAGWMENLVIPGSLKAYAAGYAYQAEAKKSHITLGNGLQAQVVAYGAFINSNQRSIVYMYWEREGNWYWVRISNSGWYWDIGESGLLKQIAEGIK